MTNLNGERAALSRVFVQCKKNRPKILTDFGCLLESSGGIDGDHSLVEVDGSGLAWKAGFRNHDIIEAVDGTKFKMKGVDHYSLLEYLREDGQTCNMLIRRHKEGSPSFYTWIAFRVKTEKGGEPVVTKRVKQSVGTDINNAEQGHQALPGWALKTGSPIRFRYDGHEQMRLVSGQSSYNSRYLGFFVSSGASEPKFTLDDFVLNMHKYTDGDDSVAGSVVAFSMQPRQMQPRKMQARRNDTAMRTLCCFGRSRPSVDEEDGRWKMEDGTEIDGEVWLSGSTMGPLMLNHDFPPLMTSRYGILGNSRMFIWNNKTGFLSPLSNTTPSLTGTGLYVAPWSDSNGLASLKPIQSKLRLLQV